MSIIRRALLIGTGLWVYAVVLQLLGRGEGFRWLAVVWIIYIGGALVVGFVVATLRDWATNRARGAVVGFVASVPISIPFYIYMSQPDPIVVRKVVLYAIAAGFFLGMPAGAILWSRR